MAESKMFCDFGDGSLLDLFLDSVPIAAGTEDIETMFGMESTDSNNDQSNNSSVDSSETN